MFASLFEVTMIDSSVGTRPLTFELSIGELCIYVLDKKVGFRTHQQLTALIFINHHDLRNVYLSQFWTRGLILVQNELMFASNIFVFLEFKCGILFSESNPCASSAVLLLTGNYGKAVEVGRSKKSQSKEELRRSREELRRSREDLNEEVQGLLESEEELDKEEVLSPETENRSLSTAMRPEPTEYDR